MESELFTLGIVNSPCGLPVEIPTSNRPVFIKVESLFNKRVIITVILVASMNLDDKVMICIGNNIVAWGRTGLDLFVPKSRIPNKLEKPRPVMMDLIWIYAGNREQLLFICHVSVPMTAIRDA
jgi:hypothetical protein